MQEGENCFSDIRQLLMINDIFLPECYPTSRAQEMIIGNSHLVSDGATCFRQI
jgi:hypothetical protein